LNDYLLTLWFAVPQETAATGPSSGRSEAEPEAVL